MKLHLSEVSNSPQKGLPARVLRGAISEGGRVFVLNSRKFQRGFDFRRTKSFLIAAENGLTSGCPGTDVPSFKKEKKGDTCLGQGG